MSYLQNFLPVKNRLLLNGTRISAIHLITAIKMAFHFKTPSPPKIFTQKKVSHPFVRDFLNVAFLIVIQCDPYLIYISRLFVQR